MNFETCLEKLLVHEGGFVDHPKDPGGATNKGITLLTLRDVRKAPATVDDLKQISDEEVARIYRRNYWDACSCDDLPAGIRYMVFDTAVHSGVWRSILLLQEAVKVPRIDGILGPVTRSQTQAAYRAHAAYLLQALYTLRLAYLRDLPQYETFSRGWLNRVSAVRYDCETHILRESQPKREPARREKASPPSEITECLTIVRNCEQRLQSIEHLLKSLTKGAL